MNPILAIKLGRPEDLVATCGPRPTVSTPYGSGPQMPVDLPNPPAYNRQTCCKRLLRGVSMKMTRRTFAGSLAAAPFVLRGQTSPLRARIKIDTERAIGEIDPKLFGNFIEHLGRCIDGGVFEERSSLSDSN